MKDKYTYKFIDSDFDAETLVSYARIEMNGVEYTATTKVCKDDMDKISKYCGCRFAEHKAELKALKAELRKEKAKCEEVRKFVRAVSCYKNFDPESPAAKAVFRQLNIRIKKVNELIDYINDKQREYATMVGQRDIVIRAIDRNKARKNNVKGD